MMGEGGGGRREEEEEEEEKVVGKTPVLCFSLLTMHFALPRAVAMVLIVIRSKLVLDFGLTTHFIHLVVVSVYTGQVPRNMFWWFTMAVSSASGVVLGIWGCQYRELRPVFFGGGGLGGGGGSNNNNHNNNNNNKTHGIAGDGGGNGEGSSNGAADGIVAGDEEQGFSRGRGRGRGRDGPGEYEMLKMNGDAAP